MRESGILLHISSLDSNYGIGTFGKAAYDYVDFLKKTDQSYWQILPLGPTSYGDSPYQTFSAFANNPYFIDLDVLIEEGLLKEDEIEGKMNYRSVNYGRLYKTRFKTLHKAFLRFDLTDKDYKKFLAKNHEWVFDYAMFMALKAHYGDKSWEFWPKEIRQRDNDTMGKIWIDFEDDINFHLFMQYKAFEQWYKLKKYANNLGIKFIGDMPIYVSFDSSDVWAKPELFQLNEDLMPMFVAGVPPDNFSADGQLWGNPLYDWEYHENNHYSWWVWRMRSQVEMFDMVRIDHFIGFANYYSIPAKDKTAANGKWLKGPGINLFYKLREELGNANIIAEDLGVITDEVRDLLKEMQYPGMKLLQFAFDSREESDYIPHLYEKNTIAYTGTHDNQTTKAWFNELPEEDLAYCLEYVNCSDVNKGVESIIKETLKSNSKIAIIPMQDYLNLGDEARMNTPSTLGGNWTWRLSSDYAKVTLVNNIKRWTNLYGRNK